MDRALPTIAIVAVLLVVLLLILMGWRRRVRRDADAGAGHTPPATRTEPVASVAVLYVATTKAGEPLERLALPGLAFRGRAVVDVFAEGVTLSITGEDPVHIPVGALDGVGAATFTIDRVVERDGLVRLSWTTSGRVAADSYLRVIDPADREPLLAALGTILAAATPAEPPTESEV